MDGAACRRRDNGIFFRVSFCGRSRNRRAAASGTSSAAFPMGFPVLRTNRLVSWSHYFVQYFHFHYCFVFFFNLPLPLVLKRDPVVSSRSLWSFQKPILERLFFFNTQFSVGVSCCGRTGRHSFQRNVFFLTLF